MGNKTYDEDIMLVSKHVVAEVGLESAILLHKIGSWCESNRRNERNFHDGYYWMYNSVKAFTEEFYFMSRGMVDRYIKKLKDGGYIITGNYNTNQYDRTLWYAVTEKGYALLNGTNEHDDFEKAEQEFPKAENTFPENEKSYNNINDSMSYEQSNNNRINNAQSDKNDVATEPEANVEAIPLVDGTEWKPKQSEYDEFVRLHPNVDVSYQFMKMRSWCTNNPQKRKTKRGIHRFCSGWLDREQDKYHGNSGNKSYACATYGQQGQDKKPSKEWY